MLRNKLPGLVALLSFSVTLVGTLSAGTFVLDPQSVSWPDSDDILTDRGSFAALPRLAVPGAALGLVPQDVIDALSDGRDKIVAIDAQDGDNPDGPIPPIGVPKSEIVFSVRRSSSGAPGTDVRNERTADSPFPPGGNPFGQASDLFIYDGTVGSNSLAPAPHGWRGNNGDESRARLRIPNADPGDNVNAYERRTVRAFAVPGNGGGNPDDNDGNPGGGGVVAVLLRPVFFSLRTGSPTLAAIGAGPGDILVAGGSFGGVPSVFVSAAQLGIPPNADLDSLSLEVVRSAAGNLVAQNARYTVNSAVVGFFVGGALVASGADILSFDGVVSSLAHPHGQLGLLQGDDIDALESLVHEGVDVEVVPWPLGDAVVVPVQGGVQVAGIGDSGEDGVHLPLNGVLNAGFLLEIEGVFNGSDTLTIAAHSETTPWSFTLSRLTGSNALGLTAGDGCDRPWSVSVFDGEELAHRVNDLPSGSTLFAYDPDRPVLGVGLALTRTSAGVALVCQLSLGGQEGSEFSVGGDRVSGDRIVLATLCDNDGIESLTAVEVTAAGLAGFGISRRSSRGGAIVNRAAHTASGNARVETDSEGLTVSNIDSSGIDGVGIVNPNGEDDVLVDLLAVDLNTDDEFSSPSIAIAAKHGRSTRSDTEPQLQAWLRAVDDDTMVLQILTGSVSGGDPELLLLSDGQRHPPLTVADGQLLRFEGPARLISVLVTASGFQLRFASEIEYFHAETGELIPCDEVHVSGEPRDDAVGIAHVEIFGMDLDSFKILRRQQEPHEGFRRGDADSNGLVELTDAVLTLGYLFQGLREPSCKDAADSNDSGDVDIGDPINTLNSLFLGTGTIPAPGLNNCGVDPTDDALSCEAYDTCE